MSDPKNVDKRFKNWSQSELGEWDGSIPEPFWDKDTPHGSLPKANVILQWSDHFFNEIEDEWQSVTGDQVGKWGDDVFGPHIHLYGFLPRFSDAIHHDRFPAKYGRVKPKRLINTDSGWSGRQ